MRSTSKASSIPGKGARYESQPIIYQATTAVCLQKEAALPIPTCPRIPFIPAPAFLISLPHSSHPVMCPSSPPTCNARTHTYTHTYLHRHTHTHSRTHTHTHTKNADMRTPTHTRTHTHTHTHTHAHTHVQEGQTCRSWDAPKPSSVRAKQPVASRLSMTPSNSS